MNPKNQSKAGHNNVCLQSLLSYGEMRGIDRRALGHLGPVRGCTMGNNTEAFSSNKVETPRLFSDTLHALWHVNTPLHTHVCVHTLTQRVAENVKNRKLLCSVSGKVS